MQDQPSQIADDGDPRIERAIILQFLRDDHEHRWSRAELEVEISNVEVLDISDALARLDRGRHRAHLRRVSLGVSCGQAVG